MSKKALGKGIGALLGDESGADAPPAVEVPLSALKPNPHQRQEFSEAALRELADSIRRREFSNPSSSRQGRQYIIIAGERRARGETAAAQHSRHRAPAQRPEVEISQENVQRRT
jgi:hypothetical protein